MVKEESRQSTFSLQDKVAPLPRNKKAAFVSSGSITNRTTPMPPPRRATSQQRFVFILYYFFFVLCLILFIPHFSIAPILFSYPMFFFNYSFRTFLWMCLFFIFIQLYSVVTSLNFTLCCGDGLWCLVFIFVGIWLIGIWFWYNCMFPRVHCICLNC